MLPSIANETVTRIRPTEISSRGSIEYSWDNAEELDIQNCLFRPTQTTADNMGRQNTQLDATLYTNVSADIQVGDRIRYDNEVYTISGKPYNRKGATGSISHKVVPLAIYKG